MIEQLLLWLETLGLTGLFTALFLEGLSIPFPGVAVVLGYGAVMNFSIWEVILVSLGMAAFYSIASLVPYFLGIKGESLLRKRFAKNLRRATRYFHRYGIWSIAFSRPFGIGNYISYIAGMSKVDVWKYIALTFLGIYPWCITILYIGKGISETNLFVLIFIFVCIVAMSIILYLKFKRENMTRWLV